MTMLLRRRELVCQQVVELVTDYIEDALSRSDRRRFEAHLRKCPNCTAYLEQMRATIRATGSLHPDDLTPEVRHELTALFRDWQSERESDDPDQPPAGER